MSDAESTSTDTDPSPSDAGSSRGRKPTERTMSFGEHLEELRSCVVQALLGVIPVLVVCMIFSRELVQFLVKPVLEALRASHQPASLQATGIFESFNVSIQTALFATLVLSSPWLLWQGWRFVAPGLYNHERKFVYILLPLSVVLTIVGTTFLYTMIWPLILKFMIQWGVMLDTPRTPTEPLPQGIVLPTLPMLEQEPKDPPVGSIWVNRALQSLQVAVTDAGGNIEVLSMQLTRNATIAQQYKVNEYVRMLLWMALGFAAAFQTPVIVLMLGWVRIIDQAFLAEYRRHAMLASLVAGSLLSPGDPLSLSLISIPLYLLYELGGVLLRLIPASRMAGTSRDRWEDDDASEDPPRDRDDPDDPPASRRRAMAMLPANVSRPISEARG